jgi:hypothetical protein
LVGSGKSITTKSKEPSVCSSQTKASAFTMLTLGELKESLVFLQLLVGFVRLRVPDVKQ